jgi:hypothetical protein
MKSLKGSILIVFLCVGMHGLSQQALSFKIKNLRNTTPLKYEDPNGRILSETSIEAREIDVIFYKVSISQKKHTIKIIGRVIEETKSKDTVGIYPDFYLGIPQNDRLTNMRRLHNLYHYKSNKNYQNKFPYRVGDFKLEFVLSKDDRLYFDGTLVIPVEYNIGKLLN